MKKWIGLVLCLALCAAALSALAMEVVVKDVHLTLEGKYVDAVEEMGPFRYWPVEEKYAFWRTMLSHVANDQAWGVEVPQELIELANREYGLPDKSSISKEQAVEAANRYLREHGIAGNDVLSWLLIGVEFYRPKEGTAYWQIRYFTFDPLAYTVGVEAANGSAALLYDGSGEAWPVSTEPDAASLYRERLIREKGDQANWSLREKAKLASLLKQQGILGGTRSFLPEGTDLPEEEALELAKEAAAQRGLDISQMQVRTDFYLRMETDRVWVFEFYSDNKEESIFVHINAATREVLTVLAPGEANG